MDLRDCARSGGLGRVQMRRATSSDADEPLLGQPEAEVGQGYPGAPRHHNQRSGFPLFSPGSLHSCGLGLHSSGGTSTRAIDVHQKILKCGFYLRFEV